MEREQHTTRHLRARRGVDFVPAARRKWIFPRKNFHPPEAKREKDIKYDACWVLHRDRIYID
jgi:hypothetical protein